MLASQPDEMAVQSLPKNLGAIDAEGLRPTLNLGGLSIGNTETEHCHTHKTTTYDRLRSAPGQQSPGTRLSASYP